MVPHAPPCKPQLALHVEHLGQMWAGHLSSQKGEDLNEYLGLSADFPARAKSTCNSVESCCLQGRIASLCAAAGRGWKGWSCMTHYPNYWCCWMNVFLSAVQSYILWEKKKNKPNLLRNHLRHEMQRKINDRNEYSAVSQTEDTAWFSCTKTQAQMSPRGLWEPTFCTVGSQHVCDFSLHSMCTSLLESRWGTGLCHLHTFLPPSGQI